MTKTDKPGQQQDLTSIIQQVLDCARENGATASEVDIGTGEGLSVTVRMGELETIEHQRDKGMGVTVYVGQRKGSANTTDFSERAIRESVEAACMIAKNASEDPFAGLIDSKYIAGESPDLDLYHPWSISPVDATELVSAGTRRLAAG